MAFYEFCSCYAVVSLRLKIKKVYYLRKQLYSHCGDDSVEDPPVPIPNTEVKLNCVDGTWRVTARESRTLPDYFFFYNKYSSIENAIFFHSSVGRASDC